MNQALKTTNIMRSYKILIVDDDTELTELICEYLEKNSYQVRSHKTGEGAVELIQRYQPDLVILDLMLPKISGTSICKAVRSAYDGSIIMLTALDKDGDEVTGLEIGADDYLCKPVKPRVLLAHIRAQLRRKELWEKRLERQVLTAYGESLTLDGGKRRVTLNGQFVELSNSEFELLWELALYCGSTISRDALHKKIFRFQHDGMDRSIDLRVSRIRKKLGDDPKSPKIIKTVRNRGYLLAN